MSDVQPYAFTDPMAAQARGIGVTNALLAQQQGQQRQATLATAGNALSTGDYAGAAGDLYKSGDLQGGLQFDNIAKTNAAAAGDADIAQKQKLLQFTADTATRLAAFHQQNGGDVNRTLSAFDQIAPQFQALGETPEDLAQVRAHLAADPQGTLTALGAGAAKELQMHVEKSGDDVIVTDPITGKLVAHYRGQQTKEVKDGEDLYRIPGQYGDAPSAPAAPGVPGSPPAAPAFGANLAAAAATAASQLPTPAGQPDPDAVWKAIKAQESGGEASPGTAVGPDTPYGNALGSTQLIPATAEAMARKLGVAWNPALMRENSPQALAYQDKIGRAYFDEGLQQNGGDPAQAAAYYFGGPDPALHGPKTMAYVQQVMARAQGGGPGAPAAPVAPATPTDPDAPQLLVHRAKAPPWQPDGKGNLINAATGDRKVDPTFQGGASAADPAIVQAVIDGRYPAPTGAAARSPQWLAILDAAASQDPTFNANDYATRAATRKDFTSGKSAQNITSMQTALGHIGALDDQIAGLNNTAVPMFNAVKNFGENALGDPRIKDFNLTKKAVATELVRVFRQAGGTESDVQDFQNQIDAAGSPAQLHTVTARAASLLGSRLDAMAQQYKQGLGKDQDGISFLNPHAQAVYSKLTGTPIPTGSSATATTVDPATAGALQRARAAISAIAASGAPDAAARTAAVKQRLQKAGIDTSTL